MTEVCNNGEFLYIPLIMMSAIQVRNGKVSVECISTVDKMVAVPLYCKTMIAVPRILQEDDHSSGKL